MEDYKKRLIDEYNELCTRLEKLGTIIELEKKNLLRFKLNCPLNLLEQQFMIMKLYKKVLEDRARFENVNLEDFYE